MAAKKSLMRQSHFLGTKIRNLRKRNHLTMEDLSTRCIQIDAECAPSVSYLSMIERGKRVPSIDMLEVIAQVFQKEVHWFLDDEPEDDAITPNKGSKGGISGMALEPSFLFTNDILQIAIPEMLSQTGISGRQFSHLLIRAYQEQHQNHFPDLERAAEEIGLKRLPLTVEDILDIAKTMGLSIEWFDKTPASIQSNGKTKGVVTSFFDLPNTIYINRLLQSYPHRLKYDLAVHLGHCVLHNKDGMKSMMVAGGNPSGSLEPYSILSAHSSTVDSQDILQAWRDFESSFFAGALLCPKVPFRQLLDKHGYEISVQDLIGVSPAVAMRRMTAVSPYSHWHYFDAYSPSNLKAVYRGNGIPLPWGNMRTVADPCQHWSVFRMLNIPRSGTSAQLSVMDVNQQPTIYSCESIKVKDMAGNQHVLCAGVDLNPAIQAQGGDALSLAEELKQACVNNGGSAQVPLSIKKNLLSVSRILNIRWVERGIKEEARVICSRGSVCPRKPSCYENAENINTTEAINQIKADIHKPPK